MIMHDAVKLCLDDIHKTMEAGDSLLVIDLCDKALQNYPDSPELLAVYAYLLVWRGRRDEALEIIRKAHGIDGSNAYVWAVDAYIAGFETRFDDAVSAAEHAFSIDSEDPWVLQWAADAYHIAGDYDTSLSLVTKWYTLYPDDIFAITEYINHLHAAGKDAEAETILADAEKRFPDSPRIWHKRAKRLQLQSKLTEAIELLRRANEAQPNSYIILAALAQALSFGRMDDEAETAAKHALEICPISTEAMRSLSRIYTNRGQKDKAEEWRKKSADAIPALKAFAAMSAAAGAMKKGDWKAVIKLVEPYESTPSAVIRSSVLSYKTRAFIHLKRFGEAETVLNELEEMGYSYSSLYYFRSQILISKGKLNEAIDILDKGLEIYPADGTLQACLLRLLHKKTAVMRENNLIQHIESNLPDLPSGIIEVYTALNETNHHSVANEVLRIARERYPDEGAFQVFDAVKKIENNDLQSARELVKGINGEWRGTARKANFAIGVMSFMEKIIKWIKGSKR
ncbi:MAG: tetratricopeptide repeat protein [Armatimonadota bacterium]